MKILHTGDTHLGDLNGPVKDGKNVRRADTLNCMRAIVDEARRELPHVTIVAGDLFNRSRVWADTALEIDKADKEEVQAVWDQMAAAYSVGVNEA